MKRARPHASVPVVQVNKLPRHTPTACQADKLPADLWFVVAGLTHFEESLVFSCKHLMKTFLRKEMLSQVVAFFLTEHLDYAMLSPYGLCCADLPDWLYRSFPLSVLGEEFKKYRVKFNLECHRQVNTYLRAKLEHAGEDFFLSGGAVCREAYHKHWSQSGDMWVPNEGLGNGLDYCNVYNEFELINETLEEFEEEMYTVTKLSLDACNIQHLTQNFTRTISKHASNAAPKALYPGSRRRQLKTTATSSAVAVVAAQRIVDLIRNKEKQNLHRAIEDEDMSISMMGFLYPGEHQYVTPLWLYTRESRCILHRGLRAHPDDDAGDETFQQSEEEAKLFVHRILDHYFYVPNSLEQEEQSVVDVLSEEPHPCTWNHRKCDNCSRVYSSKHLSFYSRPGKPEHLVISNLPRRQNEVPLPVPDRIPRKKHFPHLQTQELFSRCGLRLAVKVVKTFLTKGNKYARRFPSFSFLYVGGPEDVLSAWPEFPGILERLYVLVFLMVNGDRDLLLGLTRKKIQAFMQAHKNNSEGEHTELT